MSVKHDYVYTLEERTYIQYEHDNTVLIALSKDVDTLKDIAKNMDESIWTEQWSMEDQSEILFLDKRDGEDSVDFFVTYRITLQILV